VVGSKTRYSLDNTNKSNFFRIYLKNVTLKGIIYIKIQKNYSKTN